MFEPNNRSLLTDLLQPPRGFTLQQAVGTSFTLDLASALSVPLAFASRIPDEKDDLGIIATLSQIAERVTIFSQAGNIRPGYRTNLIALIEDVVHPVTVKSGIFHPKVWFCEYASGEERRYRFLCLTRNLTTDKSWDLQVKLDGTIARQKRVNEAQEINAPLLALLRGLPSMAVQPLSEDRVTSIHQFADRLSNVEWETPQGVDELRFHVLDGSQSLGPANETVSTADTMLDFEAGQAVVISPFVTPDGLQLVPWKDSRTFTLISRPETFERLPDEIQHPNLHTRVLNEYFAQHDIDDDHALTGLHAKAIFLTHAHKTRRARTYIGSANVTSGGLRRNLEVMVEFRGRTKNIGPKLALQDLEEYLEPYPMGGEVEEDPLEKARESLEHILRLLAAHRFYAQVGEGPEYSVKVWCDPETDRHLERWRDQGITITWALVGVAGERALGANEASAERIDHLRVIDITPFVEITVSQRVEHDRVSASTVVQAKLLNDVAGRVDKVLAHGIGDTDTFLKLLMLLLDPTGIEGAYLKLQNSGEGTGWSQDDFSRGLFESLLKSLARGDDGLEVAQRILAELRKHHGEDLNLPVGFVELWDNVYQARNMMKGRLK